MKDIKFEIILHMDDNYVVSCISLKKEGESYKEFIPKKSICPPTITSVRYCIRRNDLSSDLPKRNRYNRGKVYIGKHKYNTKSRNSNK